MKIGNASARCFEGTRARSLSASPHTARVRSAPKAKARSLSRPAPSAEPHEYVLYGRTENGPFSTRRSSTDMYRARVSAVSIRQAVFLANNPWLGRHDIKPIAASDDACRRWPISTGLPQKGATCMTPWHPAVRPRHACKGEPPIAKPGPFAWRR